MFTSFLSRRAPKGRLTAGTIATVAASPFLALALTACQAQSGPASPGHAWPSVLEQTLHLLDKVEYHHEQTSSSIHVGRQTVREDMGREAVRDGVPRRTQVSSNLPPRAPRQPLKLDARGIGFYSDVQVYLLQRRGENVCALFTRDGESITTGCAKASSFDGRDLANRLLDGKPVRVYMDHRSQYGSMYGLSSYRITRIDR